MKIRPKYILIFFLLLFISCTIPTPHAHAQKDPIVITYADFWPFFRTEADGTLSGIFYEITSEAMDRLNVDIKWESYPWARCQNYVRTGKADGIMTVPTTERAKYTYTHPTPFYYKQRQLFTYRGHDQKILINKIKNPQDIKAANLSVITYVGNGWNKNNIKPLGISTHETPKPENVWRMLSRKRGDIVIEWPIAACLEIKRLNLSNKIIQSNGTIESTPFHLLINKKSEYANILPEFEKVIQEMLNDGTIENIKKKYTQLLLEKE